MGARWLHRRYDRDCFPRRIPMTTPERLRRRQFLESTGLAILALALVAATLWQNGRSTAAEERAEQADQRDRDELTCVLAYLEKDSNTGKKRSGLVEQESQATRAIIRAAAVGKFDPGVYDDYEAALLSIDLQRAENPVNTFDIEACVAAVAAGDEATTGGEE